MALYGLSPESGPGRESPSGRRNREESSIYSGLLWIVGGVGRSKPGLPIHERARLQRFLNRLKSTHSGMNQVDTSLHGVLKAKQKFRVLQVGMAVTHQRGVGRSEARTEEEETQAEEEYSQRNAPSADTVSRIEYKAVQLTFLNRNAVPPSVLPRK
jgi:hypothetical protein